jgi:hypothetical protein
MISLSDVSTSVVPTPDMIFLYGVHGIGKTSFASQFDNPVFLLTEDPGFDKLGIQPAHFPMLKSWNELLAALNLLATQPHQYQTVVLDTIDGAVDLAEQWIIETEKSFAGLRAEYENYGRGYKFLAAQMKEKFIPALQAIKARGVSVVLLGHSQVVVFQNPEGKDWDRYQPKLPDGAKTSINRVISEKVDMVLFANLQVVVNTDGKGSGNRRVLHTTNSPAWDAKQRHGLPPTIEFSYQAFSAALQVAKASKATPVCPAPISAIPAHVPAATEQNTLVGRLAQAINGNESMINGYLQSIRWIPAQKTYRDLTAPQISSILGKFDAFHAAAKKHANETQQGVLV